MPNTHAMQDVPLVDGPVEFRGALEWETVGAAVLPLRLPAWTRAQYPDAFMRGVAEMPSGVRLAFRTEARRLELQVLTTVWHFDDSPDLMGPGVVELVVDGESVGRAAVPVGNVVRLADVRAEQRLEPGAPGTVRFADLPAGPKEIELWLPQQTRTELLALRADAEVAPPAPSDRRRWVHHGSSISHCIAADAPTGTWPAVAAALAGVDLLNLSQAGNALLDPYVARTIRDAPADLISLKVGINIVGSASFRRRTFAPAVHGFLDTVREGHPETPLLLISPILCPLLEDTPGPRVETPAGARAIGDPADVARGALTLNVVRDILARIVAERGERDRNLHYLDGRRLFATDDIDDLPDGLHPNAAGYRRIGKRFADVGFGPRGAFGQ
ncbi:GDSL-type esterase/lipase family protein [Streptomyces sp. NPDC056149]|uniref:GDSL-type esterase/lipase family protein n=1 Tax=unclassified Streptomyces TaxID=2593676 RepID=UPI002380DFB3|nr:GDSL-type esterase/lipase family protein [Streptomyces sp. WZ-12]